MKFRYRRYEVVPSLTLPSGVVYRPEARVRVAVAGREAYLWALVDSGADESVFPLSAAEAIGAKLDFDAGSKAEGVAGQSLELIPAEIELEILGKRKSYRWAMIASFGRYDDPEDQTTILGHANCLEFFKVTFDGDQREVELEPNRKFPGGF